MNRLGTGVLALAAFVGVFCASWGVMAFFDSRQQETVLVSEAGPLTARVDARFSDVKPGKGREMTKAELKAAKTAAEDETLRNLALMGAGETPADIVKLAREDAPSVKGYARYAIIEGKLLNTLCTSARPDGEVEHSVAFYNATRFQRGDPDMYQWVHTGCAAAIQAHGKTVSGPAYLQVMLSLIPNTPAFAKDRAELNSAMSSGRR